MFQFGIGIGVSRFAAPPTPAAPNPNLLLWSEEFQQATWSKSNVTVTADAETDPDGGATADLLDATALAGRAQQSVGGAPAPGAVYTFSVYLKRGPGHSGGASLVVIWDGTDNVGILEPIVTPSWQRYAVTGTLGGAPTELTVRVFPDTEDGTAVYAWGAKLEEGPVVTSYVKREGT